MWIVALVGMATALIEATLAQIFTVPAGDGSFRGGPAFDIERGLGSRRGGILFAVLLIFTFGIRRIARVAEWLLPLMALSYVLLAAVIIALNVTQVGAVLSQISSAAFGLGEAAAGITGGIAAALLNGAERGLFSNEAGMGRAPNAAATATTSDPVKQGLIQSLGVFVDTIIVCSATAFIILFTGSAVYRPRERTEGASLTLAAVAHEPGSGTTWIMSVLWWRRDRCSSWRWCGHSGPRRTPAAPAAPRDRPALRSDAPMGAAASPWTRIPSGLR